MKKNIAFVIVVFFCAVFSVSATGIERVKEVYVFTTCPKKIGLTWAPVSGADSYQIKVMRKRNHRFRIVKRARTESSSVFIKKLKPSTKYYFKIRAHKDNQYGPFSKRISGTTDAPQTPSVANANIIFLHHSTGENIWNGGVSDWFDNYNSNNSVNYQIAEQAFPKDSPYGWSNYPYDYWNIWVNHAGDEEYMEEPTLEILTQTYDTVVFKHCFPVSYVEENIGADISSDYKSIENYKLQYNALKEKMQEFPDTKFVVWTGAALIEGETDLAHAERAQEFFDWVKDTWDEDGDNIYVWDFYELETDGGLYMKDAYSAGDSHPNETFSADVAPFLSQRIIDVVNGNGDTGSLTGE